MIIGNNPDLYSISLGDDHRAADSIIPCFVLWILGAMENWGLVTFRETDLLVKQDEDSASSIRRVAQVVAHELAHQWFGNLVTLEYWGDLWLNEGFASYFEYIGAQAALKPLFPDIDLWQLFYYSSARSALLYDSVPEATHPLSMPATDVEASEQIESFFSPVPYDKK
eukprot:scaffold2885_cov25-Prasinocladus_malaysianus.AAC.1